MLILLLYICLLHVGLLQSLGLHHCFDITSFHNFKEQTLQCMEFSTVHGIFGSKKLDNLQYYVAYNLTKAMNG